MNKRYFVALVALGLGSALNAKTNSPIYKIDSAGKPVPYFAQENEFGKHRQLGAMQINPSAAGITISKPGKYILADDVSTSAASGAIRITTSNVDLDLNGFSVVNSAGRGIDVGSSGAVENIRIGNGTVRNCTSDGIRVQNTAKILLQDILTVDHTSAGNGVDFATSCTNVVVINCRADNNAGDGFKATNGDLFDFRHCIASDNTDSGFEFQFIENTTMDSCIASSNVNTTNEDGIRLEDVTSVNVRNTKCYNNTKNGLSVRGNSVGVNIEECEAIGNSATGVNVDSSVKRMAIENCSIQDNAENGVFFDGTDGLIQNCSVVGNATNTSANTFAGIRTGSSALHMQIVKNHVMGNGQPASTGAGIQVHSSAVTIDIIDNNVVANLGVGITATGGVQLVLGNVSSRNSTQYSIVGSDNIAFQTVSGSVTATAAYSRWANLGT